MKQPEDVGILFKQINDILEKNANNDLRKSNLTLSQVRFLTCLYESEEGRVAFKDLEKKFSIAQPTAVGIISRMEKKGLVEVLQSREDTRAKDAALSSEGRKVIEEGRQHREWMEETLLSGLNGEEKSELRRLLVKVLESLKSI
ncbi:MAG TPA: MarR family transcriptional regulator [Lachnospiraceae bacterium]|nr:MarR family transcriptional regulator [Lachnospiraceae bacterium]